jgi:hypothetical protein
VVPNFSRVALINQTDKSDWKQLRQAPERLEVACVSAGSIFGHAGKKSPTPCALLLVMANTVLRYCSVDDHRRLQLLTDADGLEQ